MNFNSDVEVALAARRGGLNLSNAQVAAIIAILNGTGTINAQVNNRTGTSAALDALTTMGVGQIAVSDDQDSLWISRVAGSNWKLIGGVPGLTTLAQLGGATSLSTGQSFGISAVSSAYVLTQLGTAQNILTANGPNASTDGIWPLFSPPTACGDLGSSGILTFTNDGSDNVTDASTDKFNPFGRQLPMVFYYSASLSKARPVSLSTDQPLTTFADQSITSSTTLASCTEFSVPISANQTIDIEFYLDFGAALGTTGLKLAATVPSGATMSLKAAIDPDTFVLAGTYVKRTTTSGTALDFTTVNLASAAEGFVRCICHVVNGATAGTIQLQMAQSTSSGTALTLRAGSKMTISRVN